MSCSDFIYITGNILYLTWAY